MQKVSVENPTLIPTPPGLTNLTWRPMTRADLTALVDLANACFLADGGLHFLFEPDSVEERFFPDTPGAIIGAFTPDGHLAACAATHLGEGPGSQRATLVGHVRPDQRGQGLGTYLMRWGQIQAQSLLAGRANEHPVMRVATESLTEEAQRLYLAHGFENIFEEHVMRRDNDQPLPDGPWPPGVALTNWQANLAAQFFEAYQTAFRERPGFPGWSSAAEWVESWMNDHFRPEWSLLARADNVPLGFLNATSNPPHGFIMQIGVIPTHRGRGLASALMVETIQRMKAAGAISVQLLVHVNNPGAIQAYRKLGFATIGRRARYERSVG